ncbi:MAG: acVLRF1 family peptidyl-tRNA hydrolase [Pseudonocardiales bacterium]
MALARGTQSRLVEVAPERLAGWLTGFEDRHGAARWQASEHLVTGTAQDGAVAACEVPFPPMVLEEYDAYGGLPAHALRRRRVGVLLVRLGGYAAGVFEGTELAASKVGSRQVHGRNAAGGQSQQRFARRREGQVRVALREAADVAVRVLVPAAGGLDAVVLGGDRRAVTAVLVDPRLAALRPLVTPRLLDVVDPRLSVLQGTAATFRAVRIRVSDP